MPQEESIFNPLEKLLPSLVLINFRDFFAKKFTKDYQILLSFYSQEYRGCGVI